VLSRWATFSGEKVSIPDLETARTITYQRGLIDNSALRVAVQRSLVANNVISLRTTLELTDHLIDLALSGQYLPIALVALLLHARLQAALGDEQASLADMVKALELADVPEGSVMLFVEEGDAIKPLLQAVIDRTATPDRLKMYARQLLAAFPDPDRSPTLSVSPVPNEELIEPLSKRELEILQLIGEGCSNQEIADRLVITLHTVKKHSSNIFTKLGVTSRTQAVARARQLGLL
jgi:LuxR family maltose regulon positive regulatory protein